MTNPNKRTRPAWGARIHTINSVGAAAYHHNNQSSSNHDNGTNSIGSGSTSNNNSTFRTQHICTLPGADYAASLLRRIHSEFQTIAQKRGYRLTTVTEMCCCGDGLDDMKTSNGRKRGGRKARTMPDNVLGYNLGNYRGHRIHLRLRHPRTHQFYAYEDIAGTMCHELAHCEIGPHNAKFYKLMDEIMEQHAVFMAKGIVADSSGFPMGSDDAHVLGGSGGSGKGDRNEREKAAQERLDRQRQMGGVYVLGGGRVRRDGGATTAGPSSLTNLPPAEAARRAAERRIEERRRNDSLYCLPCNEIIEILDESSSDEEEYESHDGNLADAEEEKKDEASSFTSSTNRKGRAHNKSKTKVPKQSSSRHTAAQKLMNNANEEIILIDSDDDDGSSSNNNNNDDADIQMIQVKKPIANISRKKKAPRGQSSRTHKSSSEMKKTPNSITSGKNIDLNDDTDDEVDIECSSWSCPKCTFRNNPLVLVCEICSHEQNQLQTLQERKQKKRREIIKQVKDREVEQSKEQFGGFNIYGNEKRSSRTLDHLT